MQLRRDRDSETVGRVPSRSWARLVFTFPGASSSLGLGDLLMAKMPPAVEAASRSQSQPRATFRQALYL